MILRNLRLGSDSGPAHGSDPVDVRIEGGTIVEIGSGLGAGRDFEGRWVIPGLWDNHVHFTQWALQSQRIDVSSARSADEAARMIGAAVIAGAGSAGIVIGAGFRDALWPDDPTHDLLDAVTGGLPTVLVSGDLHAVWLNSAAARQFGHAGRALLREDEAFGVTEQLGAFPAETIDAWGRAAADAAARRGVVGIADYEMTWNLGDWQRRIAAGHDALRVQFVVYTQHLERAFAEGLRTGDRFGDLLEVGGYKVLSDGSLNTRTAYIHDHYDDGTNGMLTMPPERLLPLMRQASAAGLVPWVHAIGDLANTLALDAFEQLGSGGRIEHAQLLSWSDVPRFAALGVEANVQPEHLLDDRDVADRIWAGRTDRTYAFRSLLDAGARLRFGSDAPVSPLDPWVAIAAAVERTRGGREPWHPEQRVTNAEALAASTRTSVQVGQPADLAIVELDPLATHGDDLRRMPVAATLLAGRYTHGAA